MSETEIAKQSLAAFGQTGVLRLITNGLDRSYRVKKADGSVFALRVAKGGRARRPVSAFRIEAGWIDALSTELQGQIPTPHRTESGHLVGQVTDSEGNARASTLLEWLPGRRRSTINSTHARCLGRLTGALHRHSQRTAAPPTGSIKAWDADLMCLMPLKDRLDHFPEAADIVRSVHHLVQTIEHRLTAEDVGLINADIGLHNILWHRGRATLVDFNDAGIGPYAFCLGRLVERIRLHENGDHLADALLAGYSEIIPLPPAYAKWGTLFEMAAAVFKFKFSDARINQRGVNLRSFERASLERLTDQLERFELQP